MTCEMDSLQCQMIRKLTTFYRQLKTPAMASIKIDRMEFLSQLHAVLMDLNSQSPLLNEVMKTFDRKCVEKKVKYPNFFFSCSIYWIENKNYCWQALIKKPLNHCGADKMNYFGILLHHKKYLGQPQNLEVSCVWVIVTSLIKPILIRKIITVAIMLPSAEFHY